MSHKVDPDGIYACLDTQALRHYESALFSYTKGEHFENKCIVCQHKLALTSYAPAPSKFDLLKKRRSCREQTN